MQMCLIAALWDNMNPPFRALDEWDVFLDALNRKEISKTLLNFGLKQTDYQFFFISPQGIHFEKYFPYLSEFFPRRRRRRGRAFRQS